VGVFEKETGQCFAKTDSISWSAVFGQTVTKLAETDDKIVAITAAMPTGTGLDKFAAKFPDRYFDVGIAEGHAVTFAAGLAKAGLKPVVALYSTFLQRAYDNVIHDIALQNIKIIMGIDRGGLTPDDGPTHHGLFDMAFLRCVPNLTLLSPKDGDELQDMIYTAMKTIEGPVFIRYPRGNVPCGVIKSEYNVIPLEPELVQDGKEVLFVAYGEMVESALATAALLKQDGIDATILNLRVLKPLNNGKLLQYLKKSTALFTFEAGVVMGGLNSSIMELLRDNGLKINTIHAFGYPDSFVPHGDKPALLQECALTPEQMAVKVKQSL
jgi:1-deoxy-D-xylulose-5-phosphate synthase